MYEPASPDRHRVAVLHGAGYVGGELIRLLNGHPAVELAATTSRTFAGEPVSRPHPAYRGQTDLRFSLREDLELDRTDAVLTAAEHGKGVDDVQWLLEGEFDGPIVDLSADFRYEDPELYTRWFGFTHPAPDLLNRFAYGLTEARSPYRSGTRWIANPGCFATGLGLALWPIADRFETVDAHVTALTGASGSGAQPKSATHFPTREGNVRAYKVFDHQHLPEVRQVIGPGVDVHLVPVSGPWTRGIWGTVQLDVPRAVSTEELTGWFEAAYGDRPLVRLWENELPELRYAARTPFCDLGWTAGEDGHAVVGFAIDNLLKGAASQAVQNLNLLLGLPEELGLLDTARNPTTVS